MGFSVGIVGLPNVGKSTLFQALTKIPVDIAAYPFTTIHPNVGMVRVPDQRLEKIAEIIKPEKVTPTFIEFIDIAGLVKGAHLGEGLGNQFLAQIRNCDALLMVIRGFADPKVENILGEINPEKEIEILRLELLMKDLESLENLIKKMEKGEKSRDKIALKKLNILKKIKTVIAQGKAISEIPFTPEEKLELKEYQFLTEKPVYYVLNCQQDKFSLPHNLRYLAVNLKEEAEMSELSEKEKKELVFQSQLDRLILACYDILNLITFYTLTGGKEVRAWTLKKDSGILEAAQKVHSDFKEKFIKAEVLSWKLFLETFSWTKAKEKGLVKIVGRDYLVQDGDIIEFKI